jgi:hypothetical protein
MDWSSAGVIVKVVGAMATAAAAWFAAITAYRGLNKWRAENVGKRRAELAEAVLADFYRLQEIYRGARAPFVMTGELRSMEGVSDDIAMDEHFAPVRRLMEHEEFLSQFRVHRHAFAAVFGRDAAAPFDVMRQVYNDIQWATSCLMRHKEVQTSREPGQIEQYKEWRGKIFQRVDPANDAIGRQIDAAVTAIEATCRPAIESTARKT